MTTREWNEGMNRIDSALVEEYLAQKERLKEQKRRKKRWLMWSTSAAVLCLIAILSVVFRSFFPISITPPDGNGSTHTPPESAAGTIDATVFPEKLTGSSLEFVVGSSAALTSGGESGAPPAFEFRSTGIVVKAVAVQSLPDVYSLLDASPVRRPTAYRIVRMRTEEVIHGVGIPQEFLYLIPETRFVDFQAYDSLLISMTQLGMENYVLKNETQNQVEAFPLPVFHDDTDTPELGSIIAFSDGIFDESLWATESWIYGYQFARLYLDSESGGLVVYRGHNESQAVAAIRADIQEWKDLYGEAATPPAVAAPVWNSTEARAAAEYVRPFANGVFSQTLCNPGTGQAEVLYRRYINGCQTEETVCIRLDTGEVRYSDVRYTPEDLTDIPDIAAWISEHAAAYADRLPAPPHTDTTGKTLRCLNLYGWYVKAGDTVYGVVKIVWIHRETGDRYAEYYDDAYLLFEAGTQTAREIPRDELIGIVGARNVYQGEYGIAQELPME